MGRAARRERLVADFADAPGAAEFVERRRDRRCRRTARNSRTGRRSAPAGPACRAAPARPRSRRCGRQTRSASPVAGSPRYAPASCRRIARNRCRARRGSGPRRARPAAPARRPRQTRRHWPGGRTASARASTAPRSPRHRPRRPPRGQGFAADPALALGPADETRQHRRHRMHDGAFVDAVEFLAVDLEGVDHRRLGQRQFPAAAPNARLGRAAGGGRHVQHLAPATARRPRRCRRRACRR